MRNFFFSLLLLTSWAHARLLQDEITGEVVLELSLKQACELQGHLELPLVEVVGKDKIDCMGRIISIAPSCLKKRSNEFLKFSLDEKTIRCFYGKQVLLSLACDERDKNYCFDSKKSCLSLGQKFAMNLDLFRHSVVEREKEKVLNCLFDSSKNEAPSLQ